MAGLVVVVESMAGLEPYFNKGELGDVIVMECIPCTAILGTVRNTIAINIKIQRSRE